MDAHAPFLSFREVITKGLLFFSKNQPLVGVKQQAEGQKPIGELLRESVAGMSRFNAQKHLLSLTHAGSRQRGFPRQVHHKAKGRGHRKNIVPGALMSL